MEIKVDQPGQKPQNPQSSLIWLMNVGMIIIIALAVYFILFHVL
ncbi:MAG: hypothetical protein ACM34K_16845 [Bacillota bacterium]